MANLVLARRSPWILLGVVSLATLLIGWFVGSALTSRRLSPFRGNNPPLYATADQGREQAVNLNSGFSAIAKTVTPAVVTIETSSRVRPPQFPFPFGDDSFWNF